MSTKVLLKKSSVQGKIPLATDLSYGELALNYAEGKLYFKDTSNNIKSFDSAPQLSINDLTDVNITGTPSTGQVLKWNGTQWAAGDDATAGGAGTDADTLDGFDSSYFLNYNNLSNKPTIPSLTGYATESYVDTAISNLIDGAPLALNTLNELAAALGDDANYATTITNALALKANTSSLATVATSGSYNDLTNKPTLFSGSYTDLTNKPTLFSGAYADLTGKPTLFSGSYLDLTDTPSLFSGSYNDLTNKPSIPTKTSDITNDSGYLVALDLIGYVTSSQLSSELANKQDTLVSGTSIKTINGVSILGSGDIVITPGSSESDPVYAASSWYTTTNNSSNWDTAYGWGDHSLAGYLTNTSSIDWSQIVNEPSLFSGDYNDLTNKPSIPTATSQLTNDSNYVNTTDLATKQDNLVSGTSIKTINGQSLLGAGDIAISGGSGGSLYTNTATTTDTSANQVVDTFALVDYRTVKYIIQATSASEVHSTEVTIMHNDVTAFMTEYNTMYSGLGRLFTTAADINGTNARLLVTPLVSGLTIDVTRISLVTRAFTGLQLPNDLQTETYTTIDLQTQTYPTKDLN